MPCFHFNPVLDLPITIGSYPIQDAIPVPIGPHPTTITTDNVISQQILAQQVLSQNNFSALPYPSAPSAPFPYPNDGTIQFVYCLNVQINSNQSIFFQKILRLMCRQSIRMYPATILYQSILCSTTQLLTQMETEHS